MSTRGQIGIFNADGTVTRTRVGHDAYVATVGALLAGWYETPEEVRELIVRGEIDSLWVTPETTDYYGGYRFPPKTVPLEEFLADEGNWDYTYLYGMGANVWHRVDRPYRHGKRRLTLLTTLVAREEHTIIESRAAMLADPKTPDWVWTCYNPDHWAVRYAEALALARATTGGDQA